LAKVSIKDVAKMAGVSPTTVSRVINNSDHPVSDTTRIKVEEAVKKLKFEPNRLAQGLSSNKSNIIGVVVHDISDDYFSELLKGIESVLYGEKYIVNIYNTYRDVEKELMAVDMLRSNKADAVIFTGGSLLDDDYNKNINAIIGQLRNDGSIIVGVTPHPFAMVNFEIGNISAARKVTNYLFNKGHREIAYVNGPEILNTSYQRYRGVLQAFKANDLRFDYNLLFNGDFTFAGGRKAALKVIRKIANISAVVAANDETALGLLWELKNQGYSIPEDISVVGIGDIPSAKFSYPPLTTLSLPIYKTGVAIGRYLIKALKGIESNVEYDDEFVMVERESVKDLNIKT